MTLISDIRQLVADAIFLPIRPTMPGSPLPIFEFRAAVFKDAEGRPLRLKAVKAEQTGASRRPIRLRVLADEQEFVVELTRREAVAFSEWLDEAVTQV